MTWRLMQLIKKWVEVAAYSFGMSWEPGDELMNAEMCVGCYFYILKAASLLKSLVNFILCILTEFILIHPW